MTYIPDFIFIITYVLSSMFLLSYYVYVVFLLFSSKSKIKGMHLFDKVMILSSFIYASIVFIGYIVHNVMSGIYHDVNGSGPSDAQLNFHFLELFLVYILLIICANIISVNIAKKRN